MEEPLHLDRDGIEEQMTLADSQYNLALAVLVLVLIISPIIILLVRRATNLIHVSLRKRTPCKLERKRKSMCIFGLNV